MNVRVKARKPLARRCRCGMTFDADGCLIRATPEEYAALRADPWLEVTVEDAKSATTEEAPDTAVPTVPSADTPPADAPPAAEGVHA